MTREEHPMSENAELIRRAYQAYAIGEVTDTGELVMVGVRTPGVDDHHGCRGDDRAYSVFTVREGRIVALRDCRDRQEALQVAGVRP
jgi:hypothetical protein